MSSRQKLILKNPYENNQNTIPQQKIEEYDFLFEDQIYNQPQPALGFNVQQEYSFSDVRPNQTAEPEQAFQAYSQTNSRPLSVFTVQLSGVHQKYLGEDTYSLPKKTFKTQTKHLKPKKSGVNIKFSQAKSQRQEPINLNIDPVSEGFSSLQIDSQMLFQSLNQKSSQSEQVKMELFSQMGLKQPKTLGKARSKRDFQAILTFLQKGEMPAEFLNDFTKILSTCMLVYQIFLQCNHLNIKMNHSSKINLKSTILKYPVLKPNYKILSYIRSLKTPRCGSAYELALNQDFGLRKYQTQVESLEHALRQAQWRYDSPEPVLKCLYVELLSPDCSKTLKIDLYIEHMEMNLYDFSHLLLQEATYLILESLRGYKVLFQRYGKVTVASQCIGLCSSGNFAVWMNRFHEKDTAQARAKNNPLQIIQQVINLVKQRCQPICQKYLGKIQCYIQKNKPSLSQSLEFLKRFILKNQIKVPANLRYLLNQHRIKENVTSIRTSLNEDFEIPEESGGISIVIKSPRFQHFVPSQIRTRKNSNNLDVPPKIISRLRKYSAAQSSLTSIQKIQGMGEKTGSSISLKPKTSLPKYGCQDFDEKSDIVQTLRKFQISKQKSVRSHKASHLRAKSESTDNMSLIFFNSPDDSNSPLKRNSVMRQLSRTDNPRAKLRQQTGKENISYEAETVKKIYSKQSMHLVQVPFKHFGFEQTCPFQQLQGFETPLILSPKQSLQPTFKCIPQQQAEETIKQEIYSMNNWTKTFKDLMTSSGDINVSITDGKEISTYLSDVKLTHLDRLSHQMVESLIRDGSDYSIVQPGQSQN